MKTTADNIAITGILAVFITDTILGMLAEMLGHIIGGCASMLIVVWIRRRVHG